ncbi:hypothetical protein [Halorussus caseinilyticus]|uniref:Uncharacterized protein n=1 Tax=Halorussus caseinilyticus TaxID=3034025 RepID=A0ABD5WRB1_9EURY
MASTRTAVAKGFSVAVVAVLVVIGGTSSCSSATSPRADCWSTC